MIVKLLNDLEGTGFVVVVAVVVNLVLWVLFSFAFPLSVIWLERFSSHHRAFA